MSLINNNLSIFVNVFVHYPEVYNSTTISGNLERYFNEYFVKNKIDYKCKVYVMIKSAPHNEEEMIEVNFEKFNEIYESLVKENYILDWKNYLFVFFDKRMINISLTRKQID